MDSTIRSNLKQVREFKDHFADNDVYTTGSSGGAQEFIDNIYSRIQNAEQQQFINQAYINLLELAKAQGVKNAEKILSRNKLEQTFRKIAKQWMTGLYRLHSKVENDESALANDVLSYLHNVDKVLEGLYLEFISSLRTAIRTGLQGEVIVKYSETRLRNSAVILTSLRRNDKFSTLPEFAFTKAVLSHCKDPEGFLDQALLTFKRLRENSNYEDFSDFIIYNAALNYPPRKTKPNNPEDFLNGVITTVVRLKKDKKYCDLSVDMINHAAFKQSSDPEGFLDTAIIKIKSLKDVPKYASLPQYVLTYAAVRYPASKRKPSNPEDFLDGVLGRIKDLKDSLSSESEIPEYVLIKAAVNYPSSYKKYVDGVVIAYERLKGDSRYNDQEIPHYVLMIAAAKYSADPEGFINRAIAKAIDLKKNPKFMNLPKYAFFHAAINSPASKRKPTNPEDFLDGVLGRIGDLQKNELYQTFPSYAITYAAVYYTTDSNSYLGVMVKPWNYLKKNYSRLSIRDRWIICMELYTIKDEKKRMEKCNRLGKKYYILRSFE